MSARLRLVRGAPASTNSEDALKLLRSLVLVAVPELASMLRRADPAGELVDLAAVLPVPKRTLFRACRSGAIDGATKVARRWLAPRESVTRWLKAQGPRALPRQEDGSDDALEALRQRVARGRR